MELTSPVIDCHTHLMWYPDHLSEQYVSEALSSKLVKLKRSGGLAYAANLDKHCYDAKPEEHWKASEPVQKVVVFGLQAKASGMWVPNEIIADYQALHPEKVEGWASVDPTHPDCTMEATGARRSRRSLKLRGLKLGPVYQHFDPQDRKYWPLFKKCQQYGLPIMWHQGTTFPSAAARLKWGACLYNWRTWPWTFRTCARLARTWDIPGRRT